MGLLVPAALPDRPRGQDGAPRVGSLRAPAPSKPPPFLILGAVAQPPAGQEAWFLASSPNEVSLTLRKQARALFLRKPIRAFHWMVPAGSGSLQRGLVA